MNLLRTYYLRFSITERCNLRCTYCLPEDARFAAGHGDPEFLCHLMDLVCETLPVDKIRITGGEPTLSPHLLRFVRHAAGRVPTVALTSNGTVLADKLEALKSAGLSRLNISLDGIGEEAFHAASRRHGFAEVEAAVQKARELGFTPLKVNAVATRSTDARALVEWAVREQVHLRFIELMKIGEGARDWDRQFISSEDLKADLVAGGWEIFPHPEHDEPTARICHLGGIDPRRTTAGFITTVTAPFCGTCNRIRLTSSGRFFTCLFDNRGVDLAKAHEEGGDEKVVEAIRRAAFDKAPPAPGPVQKIVMASIGG